MSFFLSILIYTAGASAGVDNCGRVSTYFDFYQCTLEKHPQMAIVNEKVREAISVYDKAAQWKNPDLAVKSIGGKLSGENVGSTEVTLMVPISQLWIRGAQKGVALAEKRVVEVEVKQALLEFKKNLIHDLYRLRQIDDDAELVEETLRTFSAVRGQISSRRVRSPDQEITLNLVELAMSEYQLRKNHITTEKGEILSKLRAIWGPGLEVKKNFLPPLREKWPEIRWTAGVSQSLPVQKAVAEGERSASNYRLTKLESLPSLSFGPVMERNTTGPSQTWSYGLALEMSLPIFSWNGGARAVAESKALQAELESAFAIRKFDYEKEILLQKYRSAVESLSKSSSREEVKRKHQRVDGYFRQGLAAGSTVIEAHRQIVEYQASQNEHEDSAVDAYIDLMTLTGGDVDGILR